MGEAEAILSKTKGKNKIPEKNQRARQGSRGGGGGWRRAVVGEGRTELPEETLRSLQRRRRR